VSSEGESMDARKALEHNRQVTEEIARLRGEYVSKYKIRVVERQDDGRRQTVEDTVSEYIKEADKKMLYDDYRSIYPDTRLFFIVIDPIEEIRRSVSMRIPVRTDADREPDHNLGDPE